MNRLLFPSVLALSGLVFAGCGDDDDDVGFGTDTDGTTTTTEPGTTTVTPTTEPATTGAPTTGMTTGVDTEGAMAMIRVVHASPDAGPVDVYVQDSPTPIIEALDYTETSDYLSVDSGDYVLEVRPAGAAPTEEPVFETDTVTLAAGVSVTAVAAGQIGADDPQSAFRILPLGEGFDAPGMDNAIVRVVHAAPDAPTVGIDVGNDDPAAPEVMDLARFEATEAAGVPIPAGMALQLGITANDETVTAFTTPEVPAGSELFVVAIGLLADVPRQETGFGLLVVGPDGTLVFLRQNPFVYVLHGAWDAEEVDVCAGDRELITDLAYGDLEPVQVPPGNYVLDVLPAEAEDCAGADPVLTTDELTVEPGQQILGIAAGEVAGDPELTLLAFEESFTLDAGAGVVRVVHAAGAPTVDVGLLDGNGSIEEGDDIIIEGLSFGDVSEELMLEPDTYELGLATDAPNPVYPRPVGLEFAIDVADDTRAWAIASGVLGDAETPLVVRIVDTTRMPWSLMN